jgi:DnaK suppressor protein
MEDEQAAALLGAEREAATDRVVSLGRQIRQLAEEQALTTHDDEHDPEGVTIAYQRAQLQGLLAGARADLAAIDRAAERLRAGRYGWCTRCGSHIGEQRLGALPAASTCIDCARRAR